MSEIVIRPATPADVAHIVSLFDMGGRGLPVHLWSLQAKPGQSALELARSEVLSDLPGVTWRQSWLAEVAGEVAGLMVCRVLPPPEDASKLPEPLRPIIALESQAAGCWVVGMLAVYPEHRGKGIGRQFLALADELRRRAGVRTGAIIVDSANEGARRLYERSGYRLVSARPVIPFPGHPPGGEYELMLKDD
jgi:ribosomal protein S18 acetylase RimI-like enzyme